MAQVFGDNDPKKLQPLTVPKIVEQLERALMDIKYNQSNRNDDELIFNKTENVPIKSDEQLPRQFIGKELMLFEMVGILNGKIVELEKKYENLQKMVKNENVPKLPDNSSIVDKSEVTNDVIVLNEQEVKINELISNVVQTESSQKEKVPILLGLDHDIVIFADKLQISKVIQTILRNSIESTGSGHIKVESFVAHEQNVLIIRIYDTGKGVPEKDLPIIFKKNEDDKKDDKEFSLNWCQKIINEHGGNISVKNNYKGGATFSIALPLKKNKLNKFFQKN